MDWMRLIAERKIEEAIEEGKFDDLPGKGKPLDLDEDATIPAHLRMASKVLKNAGVLPDWMQVQKEIEVEREEALRLRARLIRENARRRARLAPLPPYHLEVRAFAEWHAKSRDSYLKLLKSVNTSILKFNMMVPASANTVVYAPYRIDAEMSRFDAEFALLPQNESAAAPSDEEAGRESGALRQSARAHYGGGKGGGLKPTRALHAQGGAGAQGAEDSEDIRRADAPDASEQP